MAFKRHTNEHPFATPTLTPVDTLRVVWVLKLAVGTLNTSGGSIPADSSTLVVGSDGDAGWVGSATSSRSETRGGNG